MNSNVFLFSIDLVSFHFCSVGYIGDIALTDEDYRYYTQESENLQDERQSSQLKGDTGVVTEAPTREGRYIYCNGADTDTVM